jgi:hypothetical protein
MNSADFTLIFEKEISHINPYSIENTLEKIDNNKFEHYNSKIVKNDELIGIIKRYPNIEFIIPFDLLYIKINNIKKTWCDPANKDKCNCMCQMKDIKISHYGPVKSKSFNEYNEKNKCYLFSDWLKNKDNKKYDEMFGSYTKFEDNKGNEINNIKMLNGEALDLFKMYNSLSKESVRKMVSYIQKDANEFETTADDLKELAKSVESAKIKDILINTAEELLRQKT